MISLVIPLYNEEKRLEPRLTESLEFLIQHLDIPFEVVFVNDGSTDRTLEMLNGAKEAFPSVSIKILSYAKNEGKGFAVKTGIMNARAEKIIACDADFSITLDEIDKFIKDLDDYDVVIGSKKHALTNTIVKQKILRRFLGKAFTGLVNYVFGLSYTDVTCGFKGFKSSVAKELFSKQITKRWSYDAEVLFLANKKGFKIKEIPVEWKHVEGGSISPVAESCISLKDLTVIIINYLLGKYR